MLQVITDKLNNTLFLPYGDLGLFKVLEDKRGDWGKREMAEIKLAGWSWAMGTWGFITILYFVYLGGNIRAGFADRSALHAWNSGNLCIHPPIPSLLLSFFFFF